MAKVIGHTTNSNKRYKATCSHCGAIIVFDEGEVKDDRQYNEYCYSYALCPECGRTVTFDKRDSVVNNCDTKTIKERADAVIYEPKDGHGPVKACEVIAYACGYERGATEQEEITRREMIDNACKTYCSLCPAYKDCTQLGVFNCLEIIRMREALEVYKQ